MMLNPTGRAMVLVTRRSRRRGLALLIVGATVATGCTTEEVATPLTAGETAEPVATTEPEATATTTEPEATATTTEPEATATTTEPEATATTTEPEAASTTTTLSTAAPVDCPAGWDAGDEVTAGWPFGLPTTGWPRMIDADIGAHAGYDRFVLDLVDAGDLAYSVRWIAGGPTDDGSGDPVPMAGNEFLEVRVISVGSWMLEPSEWYAGPRDLLGSTKGTNNLQQATMTGDFEGYVTWHLGAAEYAPFRVFTLEDPSRLVVDICSVPGASVS